LFEDVDDFDDVDGFDDRAVLDCKSYTSTVLALELAMAKAILPPTLRPIVDCAPKT
jgi:hypothetical protein